MQGDFQAGVLTALGVTEGQAWAAGRPSEGQSRQYLVVLKRPVRFGSLLFQHEGSLHYLKPGTPLPADPAKADAWLEVTFPPGQSGWRMATESGRTQAFLCSLKRTSGHWNQFSLLRLLGPRLHNIVPEGVANGEAEYTEYHHLSAPTFFLASNIINGSGRWQSHGPDKDGRVPRGPVTDVTPTWFVLSWDEPREITGLLLNSNFKKFKTYAYRGAAGINPAVASDADWVRIPCEPCADGARNGSFSRRGRPGDCVSWSRTPRDASGRSTGCRCSKTSRKGPCPRGGRRATSPSSRSR